MLFQVHGIVQYTHDFYEIGLSIAIDQKVPWVLHSGTQAPCFPFRQQKVKDAETLSDLVATATARDVLSYQAESSCDQLLVAVARFIAECKFTAHEKRRDVGASCTRQPNSRHGLAPSGFLFFPSAETRKPSGHFAVIEFDKVPTFEIGKAHIDGLSQALKLQLVFLLTQLQQPQSVAYDLAGVLVLARRNALLHERVDLSCEVDVARRHDVLRKLG